jgi:hypothetical protein
VIIEQAVYGSFPFWDRGYDVLARSPGCRPEWAGAFREACGRFGQRPGDAADAGGLFALRLGAGPWVVAGVSATGRDDRGRPGALAFHGLFLGGRDYRRLGADPFALEGYLRRGGFDAATRLDSLAIEPAPPDEGEPGEPARRIAAALTRGRRVAVESPGPIDALAREVWRALPFDRRRRASVATWAFGVGNRFDLVGLPRVAPALAEGYVTPADLPPSAPGGSEPGPRRGRRRAWALAAGSVALAASAGAFVAARRGPADAGPGDRPTASGPIVPPVPPPGRPRGGPEATDPALRRRVAAGLIDLAERFGVDGAGEIAADSDPAPIMRRIAERLRYRGPRLSADDLGRLRAGSSPGRARALAWDAHIRRFAPDRPLPADFDRGPLRWQLEALAWSFHLEGNLDPGLAPAEVPPALADALAFEGTLAANPLAVRFPTLADYARFLARLPRR